MGIKGFSDAISLGLFIVLIIILCHILQGCTAHVGIDWNGETGVSKTTISKDFVTSKKPIEERRY